jgi:hypothetical protein
MCFLLRWLFPVCPHEDASTFKHWGLASFIYKCISPKYNEGIVKSVNCLSEGVNLCVNKWVSVSNKDNRGSSGTRGAFNNGTNRTSQTSGTHWEHWFLTNLCGSLFLLWWRGMWKLKILQESKVSLLCLKRVEGLIPTTAIRDAEWRPRGIQALPFVETLLESFQDSTIWRHSLISTLFWNPMVLLATTAMKDVLQSLHQASLSGIDCQEAVESCALHNYFPVCFLFHLRMQVNNIQQKCRKTSGSLLLSGYLGLC